MKLIKKQSPKTYTNKDKKVCHYYNYYLVLDNGKQVQIKAAFPEKANMILDAVAIYEK